MTRVFLAGVVAALALPAQNLPLLDSYLLAAAFMLIEHSDAFENALAS
jgi:hypothetical protein